MSCCPGFNFFGRPRRRQTTIWGIEGTSLPNRDDSQIALREMAERPSVIDYDLETAVFRWEAAINDYREYEAEVFSAKDETAYEILGLLESLRAKPAAFLDSDQEKLKNLALKRAQIFKWQHRLGLADSDVPTEMSNGDDIPAPTGEGDSPLHDSGGLRRLETSFSASQSGAASFSASALGLNNISEDSKDIMVPPDPLLFNSMKALQNLSADNAYNENRKSNFVRLADKKDLRMSASNSDGSEKESVTATPAPTPLTANRLHGEPRSSTSRRLSSRSIRGERPSLRESLKTPRRSTRISLRGSFKAAAGLAGRLSMTPAGGNEEDDPEEASTSSKSGENAQSIVEDISVTRVLSLTWAGRLNEVNSTQGTFHIQSTAKSQGALKQLETSRSSIMEEDTEDMSVNTILDSVVSDDDSGRKSAMHITAANLDGDAAGAVVSHHIHKIKPKWPTFLQEVWYDVMKWNNYGTKQRRIIKLTEYCILNIKNGNKISKMYYYMNIVRIWIESSTMFKMVLKDGTKLCYISQMAPTIVQQITTRVQVRIALEKTTFSSMPVSPDPEDIVGPEYSQEAAHKLIEAINTDHEAEASGVMQDFAVNLMNNIPVYGNRDNTKSRQASVERKKSLAARMIKKAENTPEYAVQTEIEKIIFDSGTDEGNTRQVFLSDFDRSKTLVSVRHFIDGLHEYLLTARGVQLALLYSNKDIARESELGRSGSTASRASTAGGSISSQSKGRNSFNIRGIGSMSKMELVDEDSLAIISFLTFSVVEESIYLPLKDAINQMLPSYNEGMDEALRRKVRQLKMRSQLEWNVPEQYVSPLGWSSAIFELTGLDRASTPSASITTLVRCCKAIYAEFKHSVLPLLGKEKGGADQAYLGADDLVPIFVYVFCKAELKTPHKYKDLMWNLCHPDQLHGECGYYLTVFESAIEYVEIEPLDETEEVRESDATNGPQSRSRANSKQSTASFNTAASGTTGGRERATTTSQMSDRTRSASIFGALPELFQSGSGKVNRNSDGGNNNKRSSVYESTMTMTGLASKKMNEATFHEKDDDDEDL